MEAVAYVVGLARCTAFYAEVLGLVVRESGDGFCVLQAAGGTLTLVQVPAEIAAEIAIEDPVERREQTPIKLVFPVVDIAHARSLAPRCGGLIDPVEAQWSWHGTERCDGIDPEGNVIQVSAPAAGTASSTT